VNKAAGLVSNSFSSNLSVDILSLMPVFQQLKPDKTGCKHSLDHKRILLVRGKPTFQCRICGSMVVFLIDSNGKLTGTQIAKFA
jgi:hypothetical protein